MNAIFNICRTYQSNDKILERIALMLIEIASIGNYYDYILTYIHQIADFTFFLVFIFYLLFRLKINLMMMLSLLYSDMNFGVALVMKKSVDINII